MSLSSTVNRVDYVGNGVASSFAYTFRAQSASDLRVTRTLVAAPQTETLLALTVDYTVSGVGAAGGGSVTLVAGALAATHKLTIARRVPLTQLTDIRNQGEFLPDVHEDTFDKQIMSAQQLQEQADRSLHLPESEVPTAASSRLPTSLDRASKALGFDASGVPIAIAVLPASVPVSAYIQTLLDDIDAPTARTTLGFAGAGGTVQAANIEANAVTKPAIADDAVGAAELQDDAAVDANRAVTTDHVRDAAVTAPKVADDAVLARALADSALGLAMVNGQLSASVAANALTIAIKTKAGTNPSATDPVHVLFRDPTDASGALTVLSLVAAASFTVSSGSTLGTATATAFRFWVLGFNDGGTFRLGLVNCLSGQSVYGLRDDALESATAEGGAGAADLAHTVYAGAAVASKPSRVLGLLEYGSGLAAAGAYDVAPTQVRLAGLGTRLPGAALQTVLTESGAVATGTTVVPADDTIPQVTEGTQFFSASITPRESPNLLRVEALMVLASSTGNQDMVAALFKDGAADAVAATTMHAKDNGDPISVALFHSRQAGGVAAQSFTLRAGAQAAGTTTLNGSAGVRRYGGVLESFLRVTEVVA